MAYKQGEIVLVPFPYSDLSGSKRRPVLVVSNNLYNNSFLDIVVVAITSRTEKPTFILFRWKALIWKLGNFPNQA